MRRELGVLDFRFLLAAVVIFVATIVAGVRIFGASEPMLATMGDQPRVEAVALPRHVPPSKPNAPKYRSSDHPFVRPAAIEVPAARPPAKAAVHHPAEVTASIEAQPSPDVEEARSRANPLPEAEEAKPRPKRAAARPREPEVINPFAFLFPFAQQK